MKSADAFRVIDSIPGLREQIERHVADAPPIPPEVQARLRAILQSAAPTRRAGEPDPTDRTDLAS